MYSAAVIIIALIAVVHFYILILEMFLWDKPKGMRVFGNSPEKAAITKVLAANQGLYNGFLATGLCWGLFLGEKGEHLVTFLLVCIVVAGVYGAATALRRILFIQAMPAAIALLLLFLSKI